MQDTIGRMVRNILSEAKTAFISELKKVSENNEIDSDEVLFIYNFEGNEKSIEDKITIEIFTDDAVYKFKTDSISMHIYIKKIATVINEVMKEKLSTFDDYKAKFDEFYLRESGYYLLELISVM